MCYDGSSIRLIGIFEQYVITHHHAVLNVKRKMSDIKRELSRGMSEFHCIGITSAFSGHGVRVLAYSKSIKLQPIVSLRAVAIMLAHNRHPE